MGRRGVYREMDRVAPLLAETVASDRWQAASRRAVVEHLWRNGVRQSEIDLDRVSLVRANAVRCAVDRESLLVARRDDSVQFGARQWSTVFRQRVKKIVDADPSGVIERDADRFGVMPQDEGQEFRRLHLLHPASLQRDLT
jgi:hypothetical protein